MGNDRNYRLRAPWRGARDEHAADPGRMSSSSLLPPASAGIQSSTVQHRIGNDWIDKGTGCDASESPDCFLDAGQRARITTTYQARVNAAHASYLGALQILRVDELLRKEPEKADWVLEILLDVVSMVVSNSIKHVAKLIAGGHAQGVVEAIGEAAVPGAEGAGAHLEHAIGAGVGAAKAKAVAAHAAHRPEMSAKKRATVNYLDMLGQAASVIFEYLREGAIAGVSDSALVVAFDSFRASNGHSIGDYKEEVGGKLERFRGSGMHMIGTGENEDFDPLAMQIGLGTLDAAQFHETKAFWVATPMGPRLGLYRRARDPDHPDAAFMFWRFVPSEFVSVAIKMHEAKWSSAPEHHECGMHELAQMGDGL